MRFQSTRPRGARPLAVCRIVTGKKFQSTRPRGARLVKSDGTLWISGFNPRAHAGRDWRNLSRRKSSTCFNPRAHAGRDLMAGEAVVKAAVSIHAPTRGATFSSVPDRDRQKVSIHAPTRGATYVVDKRKPYFGFQSTRPRGARLPAPMNQTEQILLFQSTRPRGARHRNRIQKGITFGFQSTRPRGARRRAAA